MTQINQSLNELLEKATTKCPVCGGLKATYEIHCGGCEDWKKKADALQKAKARRKAFGDIL